MNTPDFIKGLIIAYMDMGLSSRKTAENIDELYNKNIKPGQMIDQTFASQFNVSHMTCQRFYQQFTNDLSHQEQRVNNGTAGTYSQEEKEQIKQSILDNVGSSLKQMVNDEEINPKGLKRTQFQSLLTEQGILCYKQPTTLKLTPDHIDQRLEFARQHRPWKQRWLSVIFSDESQISFQPNNVYFYTDNINNIPNDIKKVKDNYPLKVHVWGAISSEKPLYLKRIEGTLDSIGYKEIIKEFLREVEDDLQDNYLFQQDNAAIHKAHIVMQFFQSKNVELLEWPSKAPAISPIENVWGILKNELCLYQDQINNQNKNDLFEIASNIFIENEKIYKCIKNAYSSLPQRIDKIIQKEGDMI